MGVSDGRFDLPPKGFGATVKEKRKKSLVELVNFTRVRSAESLRVNHSLERERGFMQPKHESDSGHKLSFSLDQSFLRPHKSIPWLTPALTPAWAGGDKDKEQQRDRD